MFPLWDKVIVPVLDASGAKRVVEIGALRGETTVKLLDRLGPESEIHVVDPVPMFDPTEHEQRFPGRYIFHRDLSHNVLPTLPPVDVALIDGDHNWYTVYHELKMLAATAREAGAPLPLFVMHDVCWPYGRRDLYYAPEQIPEEFRQPYAQRGMRRGRSALLPQGGTNPTMFNALHEGGPRNGVMTALDDFVEEHDQPLRVVVVPIYFGLAFVAEESRLEANPELAKAFQRLTSGRGLREQLQLAENLRLKEVQWGQSIFYGSQQRMERAADRYLGLLKGGLLHEHYLEDELRLRYLASCVDKGKPYDLAKLRDPARGLPQMMRRLEQSRRAGAADDDATDATQVSGPYAGMGRFRLDHLERCLDTVRTETVTGDFLECGTGRGGGAIFLRGYADAYEMVDRTVFVADRFRAGPDSGDLNTVREGFERFGLLDERVRFLQGEPADALADPALGKVAVLRVDAGAVDAVAVLDLVYDRVTLGGFVVVDRCTDAARAELDRYRAERGIDEPLEGVDEWAVCWRKLHHAEVERSVPAPAPGAARAPLAPPRPAAAKDLSVVVVVYNMAREARRTLRSLSRSYQQGVDDLDYEVVVVENGSAPEQRLGEELVRSFGPEFRYVDLGDEALPSPAHAINRGIELSSGDAIALMVDGAHMLTPGVLRFGMAGLRTFAPAVVATQQWYLGPGQQPDAVAAGYDQSYEDELLAQIEWPSDGYRLFDVGNFIGDRDWFDGFAETNCLFVPRSLLEQVGGMDGSFSMPGGGFVNLDLYERLSAAPGVTPVTILGEGSFHQVHGGTTTNDADLEGRHASLESYREHYAELRGKTFGGAPKPIHYIGGMPPPAKRTRLRRMTATRVFRDAQARRSNGAKSNGSQVPVPEDLKQEAIDAFWHSNAWKSTTWLGRPVAKSPTDLIAYQELVTAVRPDWIVETGTGTGGRALFLASVCELLGHGSIVSIDESHADDLPVHPRITYVTGKSTDDAVAAQVRELVGDGGNVLVVLGTCGARPRIVKEFDLYSPLVGPGSYVIVEDTVVNGHPVLPDFGPGPREAVKVITSTREGYVPDPSMEKYVLTFNPNGFLKRVAR